MISRNAASLAEAFDFQTGLVGVGGLHGRQSQQYQGREGSG